MRADNDIKSDIDHELRWDPKVDATDTVVKGDIAA